MSNERMVHLAPVGDVRIVRHPRSARVRISVTPSGEVKVTIPMGASFSLGEKFLLEKREWLAEVLKKLEKRQSLAPQLIDGELFKTRNFAYRVSAAPLDRLRIRLLNAEKTMLIEYPNLHELNSPVIKNGIRKLVDGGLRFEARRYLPQRTAQLAAELGYHINRVVVKNNKTNWGSCSGLKNINLNIHLMRLPDRLIDFIIVHELVHTVVPNHGPTFKATLKKHFPDAPLLEREIKKIRPELF